MKSLLTIKCLALSLYCTMMKQVIVSMNSNIYKIVLQMILILIGQWSKALPISNFVKTKVVFMKITLKLWIYIKVTMFKMMQVL